MKVEKSDTKLTQALSVITARDIELTTVKEGLQQAKQDNYDLEFNDTKRSTNKVIREAQRAGYLEGWVAALDAINLPLTSPFRDLPQVPLPEDPPIEEVPQRGQVRVEEDNPSFHELLEKIESHTSTVDFIGVDNPNPLGTVQPPMALVGLVVTETTPNPALPITKQSPNA